MRFPENYKELEKLAKQEARKLKKNATPQELANLNFTKLNPSEWEMCIYGQMTGSCLTNRAGELIKLCATKTYIGYFCTIEETELQNKKLPITGSFRRNKYWSPIEVYISENRSNGETFKNRDLIDYLKDTKKRI